MLKRILKGLGKGVLNVATGGLLDVLKENKIANQVHDETISSGSSITKNSKFYQILDMYDNGLLDESFSHKKAELIAKAIGGIATAIIVIWQLINGNISL